MYWNCRTCVYVWKHAHRRAVDDECVCLNDGGSEFLVSESVGAWGAAHVLPFDAQRIEAVADGLTGAACAQDESLAMVGTQKGLETFRKADGVAVEAFQPYALWGVGNADDIHGTDGTGLVAQFIQKRDDGLFVGQRDVEALQIGIPAENVREVFHLGNVKVEILGIDAFFPEFLGEEFAAETVAKGVADESVCFHFYFLARYMVQMPKVNRFQ